MSGAPSLKYAHLERERRFLLSRLPDAIAVERTLSIRDRYLSGTRLRLRLVEETGERPVWKLGQKVRMSERSPASLAHTTMYLNGAEVVALRSLAGVELTKTRRIVSIEGHRLALDAYHGQLDGLLIAEFDLGDEGTMPEALPIETRTEVTQDERFTGGALAASGAADLRTALASYGIL